MKTLVYKVLTIALCGNSSLAHLALFVGHVQLNDIDMQTILSLLSLMILISLYEGRIAKVRCADDY